MEIECEFQFINWYFPQGEFSQVNTCIVDHKELPIDNNQKVVIKGNNSGGYVYALKITNSPLRELPTYFAANYGYLNYIYINNCGLKTLSNDALKKFYQATYLNLSHNDLECLPSGLFANTKLTTIILAHNKLVKILPDVVDSFCGIIKTFDISHNTAFGSIYEFNDQNRAQQKEKLREELKTIYIKTLEKENEAQSAEIVELKAENANNLKLAISAEKDEQLKVLNKTLESLEPFLGDIEFYLGCEDLKDFSVILNNRRIKVHKMILAARSTVFAEMIKNNPDAEELRLTDIPVATFKEVLSFIYTDILPKEKHAEIYAVAEKLGIESLKIAITKELAETLNEENAFNVLAFALKHKIDALSEKAMQIVQLIFPDKTFRVDLTEQCEELKKFAEAKRMISEMMKKFTVDE